MECDGLFAINLCIVGNEGIGMKACIEARSIDELLAYTDDKLPDEWHSDPRKYLILQDMIAAGLRDHSEDGRFTTSLLALYFAWHWRDEGQDDPAFRPEIMKAFRLWPQPWLYVCPLTGAHSKGALIGITQSEKAMLAEIRHYLPIALDEKRRGSVVYRAMEVPNINA